MVPGKRGFEIDKVARDYLVQHGVEPYPHALGHQIGRFVHDGDGLLAPLVPRYGNRGKAILEPGNVYTIEPFIYSQTGTNGFPPIGLEEDVLVIESGAEILTTPQTELICI
jgi:Xaa-Pro aminopeptidase